MTLQPIFSWWIIVSVGGVLLGFCIWRIILSRKQKSVVLAWIRRACLVILVATMASGISVPGGYSSAGMLNLDVIFAVDTTTSSAAEDYMGNHPRLDGMKSDIIQISNKMAGARFSIITFDSDTNVILPMTSDRSSLQTIVSTLDRESSFYSQGSSIDKPIDAIIKQLVTDKKQNPQRPNVVFYLGDGEQTVTSAPKSFSAIGSYVSGGAVLGYGTTTGGQMKQYYGYSSLSSCDNFVGSCYVQYYPPGSLQPQAAISKIDEPALKKIASEMNVGYVNRNNGGDIGILVDASKIESIASSSRQVTFYLNLYWVFAIPVGLLLLWELMYLMKRRDETVQKKEAKS